MCGLFDGVIVSVPADARDDSHPSKASLKVTSLCIHNSPTHSPSVSSHSPLHNTVAESVPNAISMWAVRGITQCHALQAYHVLHDSRAVHHIISYPRLSH